MRAPRRTHAEDDRSVVSPPGAPQAGQVADRDRRAAGCRDFAQLPVREESDPLPVGREERTLCAVGARELGQGQLIAKPQNDNPASGKTPGA